MNTPPKTKPENNAPYPLHILSKMNALSIALMLLVVVLMWTDVNHSKQTLIDIVLPLIFTANAFLFHKTKTEIKRLKQSR